MQQSVNTGMTTLIVMGALLVLVVFVMGVLIYRNWRRARTWAGPPSPSSTYSSMSPSGSSLGSMTLESCNSDTISISPLSADHLDYNVFNPEHPDGQISSHYDVENGVGLSPLSYDIKSQHSIPPADYPMDDGNLEGIDPRMYRSQGDVSEWSEETGSNGPTLRIHYRQGLSNFQIR